MKKFLKLFSLMMAITFGFVLAGCGTTQTRTTKFNSDKDMFAFAAVSTSNIFGTQKLASYNNTGSFMKLSAEETKEEELDMDKINSYLQMMENLLVDNGPVITENTTSDKEGYESKLVFTVTDLAGAKTSYVIYYNQTLEGEEAAPEVKPEETPEETPLAAEAEDDEKDEEKDEEDEEEQEDEEQEYTLDGIALIDGVEYKIKGEKELEQNEYELAITIYFDENNYVLLEEEVEEDEHEYQYTVYENGKKSLEVEFELENSKEVEIEFTTNNNGVKETYEFEKEIKGDKTVIVIKHKSGSKTYKILAEGKVNPETGKIEYTYKVTNTNKEYHYQDGNKHHDPEDED